MSQFGVRENQLKNNNFFSDDDEEENIIYSVQPRAKKLKKNGMKNYCKKFIILLLFLSFIYVMTTNSSSTNSSKKAAQLTYLEVYLFNWTNPEEFNQTTKPHFTEHGPYIFREFIYKKNISSNSQTITFQQKKTWHFEPALSKGTLDDKITNLNPAAATVNYHVRNKDKLTKIVVDQIFKKLQQQLTVTQSIRQILFDGYDDDKLLELLSSKINMLKFPFNKFAWFYQKNDSVNKEEVFKVWTGRDDQRKRGLISEWHDKESFFHPGSCGFSNSSYGDTWPELNNTDTISLFIPNICTSIQYLSPTPNSFIVQKAKRFVPSAETFDNGTKFSSKSCRCSGDVVCQPSGVLNISECKNGAPVFVSYPHFYLADESYARAVDGLHPGENSGLNLVIEESGIPLRAQIGVQMNLLIEPVESIEMFKHLPRTFIPMIWYQESSKLIQKQEDEDLFSQWVSGLDPVRVGIVLVVVVLFAVWLRFKRTSRMEINPRTRNFSRNIVKSDTSYVKCPLN